ncbi:transporter substrate-binding domain-containing protein [Pseudomonas sp. 10B1]|uniref:substrate-binding periplasmic protein n=1 Tax=unclassified Pseudomonas TaxID=196821 RepID=UPI002AB4DECC|nr:MULTISPECIES: transporter substrate-binding domain-containing protein [unclassified Pseudomonas]MDY7560054.1 transporter substrate-binding domain-containing protein [Pseudomonas sp. AB6]MEA9975779.1 transporter substrate-binding domain-containing protein [Pseudomonas sp. RTS4]MEA9995793.1 transporter substrate-binding domain-containing protein [Pseudomonas sp. AA4]MEB0085586.1 transporter substrate-binding domain-containing protein [Pseudomonas sp. RTI1]MEB0124648.1 transporter substrate-bi
MNKARRLSSAVFYGLFMLPMCAFAIGRCERVIVTGSPDAPPYLWRDSKDPKHLIGANADLFKQAAQEMGLKVEILYAGKRHEALDEVRSGRMDALIDVPLKIAELEALDYIHPAIIQNEIMVWTRRGHAQPFNALADLHGRVGGMSEKIRLSPGFETAVTEHLSVARTVNLAQAFQKLLDGQFEYVLAGRYSGLATTQTLGVSSDLIAQPLPVDKTGLYVGLSFNSACNEPWLRGQLAKKMTELAASGLSADAVTRNLALWKAQLQTASVLNK